MLLASRIVSLVGGVGFFVASLLTWFWSESDGIRRTEIAWQGEESLWATICFLIAITLLAVGCAVPKAWLPLGIVELILVVFSFGLTIFHMIYQSHPVVMYGRELLKGIGAGPWVGLFSSVVMIVGSILNLCSGGPFRSEVEYMEEEEDDAPPRRQRPPRRRDWD